MSPICLPPSSLTKSSALGQGATAEIFAAWLGPPKGSVSPDCPKRVAVKIYKEGCERDFQRELNALRHLSLYDESLPGTLSLFGETSVDGRQALAMELCRCDLMTLLQSCNAGLPLDVARVYTLQMWYAIRNMHRVGVYHRDLKPENIMIAEDYSLKLCDWGAACTGFKALDNISRGTIDYMAPEVLKANDESSYYEPEKADIWSAGVTAFAMTLGVLPFADRPAADRAGLYPHRAGVYSAYVWVHTRSKDVRVDLQKCGVTISPFSDRVSAVEKGSVGFNCGIKEGCRMMKISYNKKCNRRKVTFDAQTQSWFYGCLRRGKKGNDWNGGTEPPTHSFWDGMMMGYAPDKEKITHLGDDGRQFLLAPLELSSGYRPSAQEMLENAWLHQGYGADDSCESSLCALFDESRFDESALDSPLHDAPELCPTSQDREVLIDFFTNDQGAESAASCSSFV
jgi:serine/threonine protein kinase